MRKLKGAYFGATWWPYGSLSTLRVSTLVAIWVWFVIIILVRHPLTFPSSLLGMMVCIFRENSWIADSWVSEVDSTEFANLVNSYEAANAFRNKTIRHIHRCLYPRVAVLEADAATNPILAAFKDIADAITSVFTQSELDRKLLVYLSADE